MAITSWKPVRLSLLAVTLGGVLLVAGKLVFYPSAPNNQATPFEFPESVPLADWKLNKSALLEIKRQFRIKSCQEI